MACELGQRLREARESQGASLEEMARLTRIKRAYLAALEDCRYGDLPEPVLARAHLKRYAEALGLDPAPLLREYPASPAMLASRPQRPRRRRPLAWLLLLALALALAAGYLALRPHHEPPNPPPPKEAEPPPKPKPPERVRLTVKTTPPGAKVYLDGYLLGRSPVSLQVEAGSRLLKIEAEGYQPVERELRLSEDREIEVKLIPKAPKKPAQKPSPPDKLRLEVKARSWIRATDLQGKKLYEGTARPGETLEFPLPVKVRVGNAGGVEAVVGDKSLGPLGKPGEVVTRVFKR